MYLMFALILLFQIFGESICQNGTRPNIVMVMSDAFVSTDRLTDWLYRLQKF